MRRAVFRGLFVSIGMVNRRDEIEMKMILKKINAKQPS
jgi:hypothetical protein